LAEEDRGHSRYHEAVDRLFVFFNGQLVPLTRREISAEAIYV
jgi:hypothetical protein